MKQGYILTAFFFFFIQLASPSAINAQGYLQTQDKRIVDGEGKQVLLKGIGLGGWMLQEPYMLQLSGIANTQKEIRQRIESLVGTEKTTRFYNAWLANHCRKADIDSLARWGFNSIRLPMHYNLFTLPVEQERETGNNTWLEKGFALTDSLLSWCKANNIYLILDLHAAPGGQGNDRPIADRDTSLPSLWQSAANKQKTIALWKKLAKRYANEEWIGGYDLLNETNWGFADANDKNGCAEKGNEPLRQLLMDITKAIREVDKHHIIYIEANCWANNYEGIFPLWDKNIVVSFHKYWNDNNTGSIQKFLDIREQHNVPVWLGESGENSNVWFTDAIQLVQSNEIGWAWWPLKKFGFNNPLQVKMNEGYKRILDYWRGKGSKPSPDEAYNALMQLTEDIKAENCIWHRDVIDAMFRQPYSNNTLPFKEHTIKTGSIVYAVDYDLGRNGYAYYDIDTANYRVSGRPGSGNKGSVYRNDGVDIETCDDDINNGYNVFSTSAGEWLQYSLNFPIGSTYNIRLRYSSDAKPSTLGIFINDTFKTKVVLNNRQTNQWSTITVPNLKFEKGTSTLRIRINAGSPKLNYIEFDLVKNKSTY
jgi:hypothetical protein